MKKRQPRDLFNANGEAFSALEPRVLLSGDQRPELAVEMKAWHGAVVETVRDSWIVTFSEILGRDLAAQQTSEVARALGVPTTDIRPIGRGGYAAFETPSDFTEEDVARVLRLMPNVMQIEPNVIQYQPNRLPNDPQFGQQWGHQNSGQAIPAGSGNFGLLGADISLALAWDTTVGSESVIVAVIDTGVDWTHPDLAANMWINPGEIAGNGIDDDGNGYVDDIRGFDFADGDNDVSDFEGHGTAVAGVIGAVGNNGIGIAGVAWSVKILPLKIFPNAGGGAATEWIVAAQDYATDIVLRGHNLVASNNSYGGVEAEFFEEFRAAEEQAIQRFTNTGATFVASAGNESLDNDQVFQSYPASYDNPEIISVAATNNLDELTVFSNYGLRNVDLAAPGELILTTAPGGGYQYINGTSFSSPYVAGAVALLKAFKPNASQEEVKRALILGSDPLPSLQNKVVSGGRLNVAESLRIIAVEGPEVTAISPGPVSADVTSISISFNKTLQTPISSSFITLRQANGDSIFDADDTFIVITDSNISYDGVTLTIDLSASFPGGLPIDLFQLTLDADGFRDLNGNYLNGASAPPTAVNDEQYTFRVTNSSGAFEPNDTITTATPVVFNANGHAEFVNAAIGDGPSDNLDVDLYRVFMSGPGLLVASVVAQRLPAASSLDSYLRLFDANGNFVGLPVNDNFDGLDSRIEFFVPTGGTYYIGVSGFGNQTYNPQSLADRQAQSTGDYNLLIDVAIDATDSFSSNATAVPVAIPDASTSGSGRVTNSIFIADTRSVVDINVRVDITHPFAGDLQIRLFAPDGRSIVLVLNRGTSGDNFVGTVFDDEAGVSIVNGAAPFTGSFRPEVSLNTLDGMSAAGTWTIEILDTKQIDAGTLVSWGLDFTLQNDIFGLFELNDTIGLATNLDLGGLGTAVRDADIGDGAFGLRDVDLFRFSAASGTTLTASLNVIGGQLDTILRLFDENGNELLIDNRTDTTGATITFSIDQGGAFYLGVSGAGNAMYSILNGGSGAPTSATGSYRLRVNVVGGISSGGAILRGNQMAVGVNADGSIGVPLASGGTGLALNGVDFLVPQDGRAFESFFGGIFNGFIFRNAGGGDQSDLAVSIANESDGFNRRVTIEGAFRGLGVRRTLSFGVNDTFVAVDISLTNLTSSAFSDLAWMEGINPQIGFNRNTNIARTVNNVQNATGRLVTGSYSDNDFPTGLTIGLGAAAPSEGEVVTAVEPLNSVRDPFQILNDTTPDPDPSGDVGVNADELLTLAFDVGSLGAGGTATFRYFFFLGSSVDAVNTQFQALESGAGTGHLVADPESGISDAETLPYALYYPEGYANDRASTFIPILNPNQSAARVVVIAHYERGFDSEVLYDSAVGDIDGDLQVDGVLPAHSRSGLTVTTPELYAANSLLVRKDEPYSIEIRSSQPVGANLSHFDFNVATGETFTSTTSTAWTVAEGFKGAGINDFVVFFNPTEFDAKVTLTIYPETGVPAFSLPVQEIGPSKRGGWSLADIAQIPDGPFGIKVTSDHDVVAALTHYDQNIGGGFGVLAQPNLGSLSGVTPEGQLGINAENEFVTILNPNAAAASVAFTFFFADGSSYRQQINVAANRRSGFAISALPGFPAGEQPFSIAYESSQPVTVTLPSYSFGEATGSEFSSKAHSTWMFADGFRPVGSGDQVTEYLRLYNPTIGALSVEITLSFNDGSSETFRRTISSRTANEFNIFDFVTGARAEVGTVPGVGSFYGIRIRSAQPIVAYMGHFDSNFFGGFGTLGYGLDEGTAIS